jgi:putative nucleotidyltransferase with HDIG domain
MFGFFERQRLVKRGFAGSKQRRRRTESEFVQSLESGWVAKVAVFVLFILGFIVVMASNAPERLSDTEGILGGLPREKVVITLLIVMTSVAWLWINHPETFERNSRLGLIYGVILLHLAIVKFILVSAADRIGHGSVGEFSALELSDLWKLAVPYSFAPLLLSVLLGRHHGIFAAIYVSLLGAFIYRGIEAKFLVASLMCGFIAVFVTLQVRRRSRLIRAGFLVGLSTWLLAIVFGFIPNLQLVGLAMNWKLFAYQSLMAIGSGVVTALLVSGALPIFEGLFGITTEISWLEMADLNHPLLKRMMLEAPGTYQHSLVVATLAEAACESIGANATLARVCSYFHDIGKLVKPEYFTENMRHGRNPHDDLAPTMSALIIIAHVKEGVDFALKHSLNDQIIDVIQQHHGTSLVYYFYKRALQQQEDTRAGGKIMNIREEDVPEVREESFRYSGPRPQTRETAVISLADSIESAARSLERVTPQKIDQLIRDLMERRLVDGQLRECDLTMRDLETVAESFRNTLQSMMHSRIAYPDDKEKSSKSGLHQPPTTKTKAPMSAA